MNSVIVNGSSVTPSKILCVGRNYTEHIFELGNEVPSEPVLFMKPNSALGTVLHSRAGGEALHYESELAFIVTSGQFTAVGLGLDLTRRQLQSQLKEKGLPWERAKAFDGAALFSEFVPVPKDISGLGLRLEIDGELRQEGGVRQMLNKPADILRAIAAFATLEDGDIVMTGTPSGVGEVIPGQTFHGSVLHEGRDLVAAHWQAA
ncbi:MAG: fumarylacetoacetate hydrolase family protein [Halioglobus sp.]|nr:fumarylacetoacetate hydrolase family protein [Halioglobus sp.]